MNSKTVLLIEDNPSDIELTKRAFKKNNIVNEILVMEDGQEALDYLFNLSTSPEQMPVLTLLDMKLPRIDGLEVLNRIRSDKRTKRLPVVMLTSSKEEQDIAAAYDNGANSYIRKPVDFKQFVESIRTLGMYWLELNEPPPMRRE
ncbi:MAG: response regulator [Desulfamplus sp.]|nr:response regulator [Desulfamplus sp.]MBF0412004.1 response regulator [Desulfamplus sp.]